MLQMAALNRRALRSTKRDGARWSTMEELSSTTDAAVAALRRDRRSMAVSRVERLATAVDARVRTETTEFLDRPGHPEALKVRQIRWLHRQNLLLRAYPRFLRLLEPSLREAVAARGGQPARLLELASGSGDLTLALAREARRAGVPVVLTGSDIVPAYVDRANRRARSENVPATFRELNAFDLTESLSPGDVDVAFIVQSIHHFSAGQLAMMIAQVGRAGARRFVGVDGRRGLLVLGLLPAICSLSLDPYFVHDAFVSMRRLYAEAELELIATIAAPGARIDVVPDGPFVSTLTVDYTGAAVL